MKKILLLLLASYSCHTLAMEGDAPICSAETEKNLAILLVIASTCKLEARAEDTCKQIANYILSRSSTEQYYYTQEEIQKNIVEWIRKRLAYAEERSDYTVATELAKHIPSYQGMAQLIKEAFNPQCTTHDAWYANSLKEVPVKYSSNKTIGRNGGLMTPLSFAIKKANFNWVGRLIAEGADVNREYPNINYGTTYGLCETIEVKNEIIMPYLSDKLLQTKAHQKIQSCDNIIRLLLKNGACVNSGYLEYAKSSSPVKPLQLAIHHEDIDSVKLLIKHGATVERDSLKQHKQQWLDSILQP